MSAPTALIVTQDSTTMLWREFKHTRTSTSSYPAS
jgi:hypothetical protein